MRAERLARIAVPGSAESVLASGVAFLAPEEAVLEAMLAGWIAQQTSRLLALTTIEQRVLLVRRLVNFSNDYPWRWTPSDVEEWTTSLVATGLAHSTLRNYQMAVQLFCSYVTDRRYGWDEICEQRFGSHPVQVFHEWNTGAHRDQTEGRPGNRPLSRQELQTFFDYCDERVAVVTRTGRKGWLAAFRDAVLFKTVYAFGLRRQEAAMLDLADLTANPHAPEFGRYGALSVRYGKAKKGSPPRRRTVLTTMGWSAQTLAEWVEEIRPGYGTTARRCGRPSGARRSRPITSTPGSRPTVRPAVCPPSLDRTVCGIPIFRTSSRTVLTIFSSSSKQVIRGARRPRFTRRSGAITRTTRCAAR